MASGSAINRIMCLLIVCLQVSQGQGLRVLIYPYGHCLNSHLLNAEKMARVLSRYGHQVSVIVNNRYPTLGHVTASSSSSSHEAGSETDNGSGSRSRGYVEMLMFDAPHNFTPICEYDTVDFVVDTPVSIRFHTFIETAVRYCDRLLADAALMRSLKQRNFDVFVVEAVDPCGKILADYLDIPFVPLMTTGLGHGDGNTRLPSHVPAPISWFTPDMTLGQRVVNVLLKVLYDVLPAVMHFTEPFEQLKVKYNLNTSLSLANTFDRASLTFVNSDFAVEYPVPLSPDTVLIGGLFFDEPRDLDPELAAFIQGSGEAGVVVVSMGTLVGHYSARWTQLFLSAFARLSQRVIWRYAGRPTIDFASSGSDGAKVSVKVTQLNDTSSNHPQASPVAFDDVIAFPPNVLVRPWLPQAELLAHPKTRLFVTHCGLNAMFETVRAGVPVVALPLSGDQFYQAAKLADHVHMGVKLDVSKMTSDDLFVAMTTVIGEPAFKHNAVARQARLLDQPMPVADKVNYWLNYVTRHAGDVTHLRTGGRQLTFCQYYSLDVAGILLTIILSTLIALFTMTRFCFHRATLVCRSVK